MNASDLQRFKKTPQHIWKNSGKPSHAMKEKGSTEIISKYNNYHITEIVTDLTRNEVTQISKITKETLEDIIGGYVCVKRKKISENISIIVKSEPLQDRDDCRNETSDDPGDSSKFLCKMECSHKSTEVLNTSDFIRKCYVKLEYNEIIEHLQNQLKKKSKSQEMDLGNTLPLVACNNDKYEESKSISVIEHPKENMKKTREGFTKECYIKMKKDLAIENMQNKMEHISQIQIKNANRSIFKCLDSKYDEDKESQKLFADYNTEELLTTNLDNKSRKRKKNNECCKIQNINSVNNLTQKCESINSMETKTKLTDQIFNSFYSSKDASSKVLNDMCHYERENNILLYKNMRLENSLIEAISRVKFLERELHNFERINYYTFLKKYFKENEITALIDNSQIDWNNAMITKALQLRFACGNEGYEEILKTINLPSLKTLRNRVHNSQFDLALLAKDMINF